MSPEPLDYEISSNSKGVTKPKLTTICAGVTVIISFAPVWLRYYDALLIPGCIGWIIVLTGLRALWKSGRGGTIYVLIGPALLMWNLVLMVIFLSSAWWHFGALAFDAYGAITFLAFVSNVLTAVLLAKRLM